MICKIYGYKVKHCACVTEECCMMESCAVCLTRMETEMEKEKCCGKCKIIELDFSEETKELAKKAVEKCEKCKGEDVNTWANKLANDVYNAND